MSEERGSERNRPDAWRFLASDIGLVQGLETRYEQTHSPFDGGYAVMPSRKHSGSSQDAFILRKWEGFGAVIDGMGGHPEGEVAARIAQQAIAKSLGQADDLYEKKDVVRAMREAFWDADDAVAQYGEEKYPAAEKRPAATLSMAHLFRDEDDQLWVVSLGYGDARVYVYIPGNGESPSELAQLTVDNVSRETSPAEIASRREHQREEGLLTSQDTDEAKKYFATRNLVDFALGLTSESARVTSRAIPDNAMVLVCGDGLSDNLTTPEILRIFEAHPGEPQEAARHLVASAHIRTFESTHPRSHADDITAVVLVAA